MATESSNAKVQRGPRSPSYPSIDLKTAISRVEKLKEYSPSRKPIPIDVALRQWSYKPKSGAGMWQVAALKKFGLLEDEGSGVQRSVRLTDRAWRILTDPRADSPARHQAIREAALLPQIHQDVREHWPHGLPSDQTIQVWLVQERGFNEKSVKGFLSQLRSTFDFAKLDSEPMHENNEEDKPVVADEIRKPPPVFNTREIPTNALPLPVLQDDGSIEIVPIPRMSQQSFEFFKKQLENYRPAIVREGNPSEDNGDND